MRFAFLSSRRNARRKVKLSLSNAGHLLRQPAQRTIPLFQTCGRIPQIRKAGKRHDLLMEAKRQVRGQAEGRDVWSHQQQAALDWLAAQGRESGFTAGYLG